MLIGEVRNAFSMLSDKLTQYCASIIHLNESPHLRSPVYATSLKLGLHIVYQGTEGGAGEANGGDLYLILKKLGV